jgi:dipeptidyl aminopeptidase/acylaminoacyl peptidase
VASARPEAPRPFLASTQIDEAPQFSPDGRRVAFSSTRISRSPQIWVCDADGEGCAQVTSFKEACGTPRWSPDSRRLAFDSGEAGQPEIFVVDVDTAAWRQATSHPAVDVVPSWSHDGASIYFSSDRTGIFQVWRMPAEGGDAVPVTTSGGFAAFETTDGQLYFSRYEKPGLWAVPVGGGPERPVLDQPACWGYWALAPHGVFVLDSAGPQGPRIALHRWGSRALEHVAALPAAPACGESGLALSPDASTLLYVGAARDSDIVMVDNFR